MFNEWDNKEILQELINKSKSRRDVLELMGYNRFNKHRSKKLSECIIKYNLDTSSFTSRRDRWDNLSFIVSNSNSYREVLIKVGLKDKGENRSTLKKYIKEMSLDISHFIGKGNGLTSGHKSKFKKSYDEILIKNSQVTNSTLRRLLLEEQLLEYNCLKCGLGDEWMGEPITLQIDHINGIDNDNRIENLRFLCPNCHTQTSTWGSRNK
jgi:5-methylcytosine-specific restriction endonuclease McrA